MARTEASPVEGTITLARSADGTKLLSHFNPPVSLEALGLYARSRLAVVVVEKTEDGLAKVVASAIDSYGTRASSQDAVAIRLHKTMGREINYAVNGDTVHQLGETAIAGPATDKLPTLMDDPVSEALAAQKYAHLTDF